MKLGTASPDASTGGGSENGGLLLLRSLLGSRSLLLLLISAADRGLFLRGLLLIGFRGLVAHVFIFRF